MKLSIAKINTEIVPMLHQLDDGNAEVKKAKEAFFAQTRKVYEDERFKQLSAQLDANKRQLEELELKDQLRKNINQLEGAISNLQFDFQPVKTAAPIPAGLSGLFEKEDPKPIDEGPKTLVREKVKQRPKK